MTQARSITEARGHIYSVFEHVSEEEARLCLDTIRRCYEAHTGRTQEAGPEVLGKLSWFPDSLHHAPGFIGYISDGSVPIETETLEAGAWARGVCEAALLLRRQRNERLL